jgi:glycerol uptake facilitator-like aquaporin
MVKPLIEALSVFLQDLLKYFPPGILLTIAPAFIDGGKYFSCFRHELIGTLLMIACTFSAGKWIGTNDVRVAWASHAIGVVFADYFGGGPNVNPAVTVAMWSLSKLSYTECYVRIAGQLCGGLIAFPFFHAISDALKWTPFGGPEFKGSYVDAFLSEFGASLCLMFAIYTLNWEIHFGKYHYIIKQTLTAVAIRALIELFPTAGPAMNPMLATTWDVFGVGATFQYPSDFQHYFVYWVGPCVAAVTSAIIYTAYAGGTVFGITNQIGPMKKTKVKNE